MSKKKWITLAVCLALIVGIAGVVWATASAGSAEDPLVAKSYIDSVFKPQVLAIVDEAVAKLEQGYKGDIESLIKTYSDKLDEKTAAFNAEHGDLVSSDEFKALLAEKIEAKLAAITIEPANDSQVFKAVSLASGAKLVCSAGCEFMLRSGSVAASGSAVEVVSSAALAEGAALGKNRLCIATGSVTLTAKAASVVLIRGDYK